MIRTRLLGVVASLVVVIGCGKDSPTSATAPTPAPIAPAPTSPAQSTIAMDGLITETAPTSGTRVPNGIVRVVDGPSAGAVAQGDGNGYYRFPSLVAGTFRVEVSAPFYDAAQVTVTRNASGSMPFNVRPVFTTVDRQWSEAISGGDARCQAAAGSPPCKTFRIGVHHDGTLDAVLTWGDGNTDLDLGVYQDAQRVASADQLSTTGERIATSVRAGTTYEVRVVYARGASMENFTLRVRRPS